MISISPARLLVALAFCLSLLPWLPAGPVLGAQPPVSHTVTWDSHSLLLDGRRLLLYSGEFHYFRLPSPGQWEDRLEKMKAAGLNAVSIYFDWQYHSFAPGQYDFTGVRDVDHLLSITDRLGLYVIARVGPYMNGEVDAGGLPGWLLAQPLYPRSQLWDGSSAKPQDSPLYVQYSKEWYDHLLPILARHQVTTGGSVILLSIENEYSQTGGSEQYMRDLYGFARADGITVPIFHNDFYFRGDWDQVVDLYAYDSYPYGFQCCHQWWDLHFHGIDTWETTLRNTLKVTTPMFVSELQGGAFQPWGSKGYSAVASTFGPDWLTDIDESALAQGTTILNTYMFVGGTNWGYMSEPGVYSSYDYGAPISEAGALRPAYYAAHRLGMFLQSYGPTLAAADAAPAAATASDPKVAVHTRVDAATGQAFIFLRHGDAGNPVHTTLRVNLGGTILRLPQQAGTDITLPGHGAALLTANVAAGPLHLRYSTSQVLTDASTAEGDYLVLYGPPGSSGETSFADPGAGTTVTHNEGIQVLRRNGEIRLNYTHTGVPGSVDIATPNGRLRLIITTTSGASRFWQAENVLLSGPNLVTESSDGPRIWIARHHSVRVYGAPPDGIVRIDGRTAAAPDATMGITLLGDLSGAPTLKSPRLTSWKFQSEAPEVDPGFDDSSWTQADHAGTSNPNVPPSSSLLADDYGFHYGFVWYRGHFTATGAERGITIAARQCYSVYLNGAYLGSGNASLADPPHAYASPKAFTFPRTILRQGADNVVAVLTESLGHDEGWLAGPLAQSPQGLLSAQMQGAATPIAWRLQGDAGGEHPADAERGLLNASGLSGERAGWYQPSFDDASWVTVSLPDRWTPRGVTSPIGWYRTHFSLNDPADAKVGWQIVLPHASDKAVIWVNGWLIGRYWEQRGPQHDFYVPDGVLNSQGDNVVAIAVWNRGHVGGLTSVPRLQQVASLQSHLLSTFGGASGTAPGTGPDYWHTEGNRIVDSADRPVRLNAVNWFGMENKFFVPAGLEHSTLDTILGRVRTLGFNAIRLPFSNELVEKNPIVTEHLDANPHLRGLHALDVMDRIIAAAGRKGLRVILDDGRSDAGTQPQGNGLWYTKRYPESAWIHDWETIVTRYNGNATVIGVDLRNEPHTGPPGPWSLKTYLTQGATWGPYNGVENRATDWRLAAERGGNAVLRINPHLLIFVEGIQQYPDATQPGGVETYWWGGILDPAAKYPVVLHVPNQMVYSPHEYGPIKYQMTWFGKSMTYASMLHVWVQHWGFLERRANASPVPIFIGEFGTCGTSPQCVTDPTPGSQGLWFSFLVRYLRTHPEVSWSFWALNGTNHVGSDCPQYILDTTWRRARLPALVDTLRDLEIAPPPAP